MANDILRPLDTYAVALAPELGGGSLPIHIAEIGGAAMRSAVSHVPHPRPALFNRNSDLERDWKISKEMAGQVAEWIRNGQDKASADAAQRRIMSGNDVLTVAYQIDDHGTDVEPVAFSCVPARFDAREGLLFTQFGVNPQRELVGRHGEVIAHNVLWKDLTVKACAALALTGMRDLRPEDSVAVLGNSGETRTGWVFLGEFGMRADPSVAPWGYNGARMIGQVGSVRAAIAEAHPRLSLA